MHVNFSAVQHLAPSSTTEWGSVHTQVPWQFLCTLRFGKLCVTGRLPGEPWTAGRRKPSPHHHSHPAQESIPNGSSWSFAESEAFGDCMTDSWQRDDRDMPPLASEAEEELFSLLEKLLDYIITIKNQRKRQKPGPKQTFQGDLSSWTKLKDTAPLVYSQRRSRSWSLKSHTCHIKWSLMCIVGNIPRVHQECLCYVFHAVVQDSR